MNSYLIIKSMHLIGMVCWFAGLFYLPRLFVYHTRAELGSHMHNTFVMMERKLLYMITTPSMVATIIFGLALVYIDGLSNLTGWFHAKMLLVLILIGYHHVLAKYQRAFATGANNHSEKFYRIINEVPALCLIGCVFLAICKPF